MHVMEDFVAVDVMNEKSEPVKVTTIDGIVQEDVITYCIIGFPKCGSTSLRDYLQKIHPHSSAKSFPFGSLWLPGAPELARNWKKPRNRYWIITRDPYERLWSSYWWGQRWHSHSPYPTFEKFLHQDYPGDYTYQTSGLNRPLECCDYDRFIKPIDDLKIPYTRVRFEDMIKKPGFPHIGDTNEHLKGLNFKPMLRPGPLPDHYRDLIKKELDKLGIGEYK